MAVRAPACVGQPVSDGLHTGADILDLLPAVLSLANGLNNKGKMYERNERHIKFVLSGCHGLNAPVCKIAALFHGDSVQAHAHNPGL